MSLLILLVDTHPPFVGYARWLKTRKLLSSHLDESGKTIYRLRQVTVGTHPFGGFLRLILPA